MTVLRALAGSIAALGVLATGTPVRAETYTYDALGRLIQILTDDSKQVTSTFDPAGNRTSFGGIIIGGLAAPTTSPASAAAVSGADSSISTEASPDVSSDMPLVPTTQKSVQPSKVPPLPASADVF